MGGLEKRGVWKSHCFGLTSRITATISQPFCHLQLAPQARKLEGELDVKLAAYAKLCSGFEANYRLKASDSSSLGADQVPTFVHACVHGVAYVCVRLHVLTVCALLASVGAHKQVCVSLREHHVQEANLLALTNICD